jgi:Bifunctional DNA primase/polymerase, N-terminal
MSSQVETARLNLLAGGYAPLPLIGKRPIFDDWPKRLDVTPQEIERWSRASPAAENTGILTKFTPALDIDILDPDAAAAIEVLAKERFEEHGYTPVRIGKWPKRALLFRCDQPFRKITAKLVAPDGSEGQGLEIMADGQQIAVSGRHPDTGQLYAWHDGAPGDIARADLAYIHVEEAQTLVDDAVALLVADFGYRLPNQAKARTKANGVGGEAAATEWACDFADHDQLAALAMKLIRSGMNAGAVVNYLRAQVEGLTNIDPERKARRLKEIPGMVESAQEKLEAEARPSAPPEPPPPPSTLDRTVAVFRKWLLLDDVWPVYVTLGAIAANHLPGPPVWLGLIAPPSSAKTEILSAMLR